MSNHNRGAVYTGPDWAPWTPPPQNHLVHAHIPEEGPATVCTCAAHFRRGDGWMDEACPAHGDFE